MRIRSAAKTIIRNAMAPLLALAFLMVPFPVRAQTGQAGQTEEIYQAGQSGQTGETSENAPPVEQPLLREGDFALQLVKALKLGRAADEVEAETKLGNAQIAPRDGWIADYPVTPDIVAQLRSSVSEAARAKRIKLSRDEALKVYDDLTASQKMAIEPYQAGESAEAQPPSYENYASPDVVNNYYYDYGPPVVTYYTPPPDYYYLYAWVPYPFWWYDFFFPGYYCLRDFHRIIVVGGRVVVISNHFVVPGATRVFRIDPVRRFNGRSFAGIGVRSTRGMISTGIPHSSTRVFNRMMPRAMPPALRTLPRGGFRAAPGGRFPGAPGGRMPGGGMPGGPQAPGRPGGGFPGGGPGIPGGPGGGRYPGGGGMPRR